MIVHLDGEQETVDYNGDRTVIVYDNVENEEYPTHWHNALEVIMPLKGGYTAICSGNTYLLEERDILLIPAGALHQLPAQPGRRLIMLFDDRTLGENPALSEINAMLNEPVLIGERDQELRASLGELLGDIYTLYSSYTDLTEVHIYIKLLELLVLVSEHRLRQLSPGTELPYGDRFRFVLRYIDQNYAEDIDLDHLAALAGYSRYYFSRCFKKYCGTTFIAFLNQRRIRAAEVLLMDDRLSVTDVAMRVGFSSLTTFNRVFKEQKGRTPSEFRSLYRRHGSL